MDQKEELESQTATDATAADETSASAPEELSAEDFAELKKNADKAAQLHEQLLRMAADLENFKKRAAREKQEAIKFANESLLEKLLPIIDNFDMALTAANTQNASVDAIKAGVQMIAQQLKNVMTDAGLQEVDAAGKAFDPNFHEAISQQESADVPEGTVVHQTRKGYRLRDRLLRPASVVVAKRPA